MCLLSSTNWGFISQKTAFFIVTAVSASNPILLILLFTLKKLQSYFHAFCRYYGTGKAHIQGDSLCDRFQG
jgi:hypothetical protein